MNKQKTHEKKKVANVSSRLNAWPCSRFTLYLCLCNVHKAHGKLKSQLRFLANSKMRLIAEQEQISGH